MEIDTSNASTIVKCIRRATGMTQEALAHVIGEPYRQSIAGNKSTQA